jgi:CubicO group peptidase (beta-lactamase class C family)
LAATNALADIPDAAGEFITESGFDAVLVVRDGDSIEVATSPNLPAGTRVSVGSISKVVTALLADRAAADGVLDLDLPIGEYLGAEYPQVTSRQLLTHTAGLDQSGLATAADDAESVPSLEDYLSRSGVLRQVAPAAKMSIYSSPGIALAGLVLERVYQRPFAELATDTMHREWGMRDAGYVPIAPMLGTGDYAPYYTVIPPAGNVVLSIDDMQAMLTEITSGRHARLAELMFSNTGSTYGRTLGLSTRHYNDSPLIHHDGGAPGINARLMWLPDHDKAFFLAYASNRYAPRNDLTRILLESWLGPEALPLGTATAHDVDPAYAGSYVPLANTTGTIEWLASLFAQVPVSVTTERLKVVGKDYPNREGERYFRDGSPNPVSFATIDGERYLFIGNGSYRMRDSLWENPWLHLAIAVLAIVTALVMFWRSLRGARSGVESGSLRWSMLACSLGLLMLLGAAVWTVAQVMADFWIIAWGMPLAFTRYLAWIVLALGLLLLADSARQRRWMTSVSAVVAIASCLWLGALHLV